MIVDFYGCSSGVGVRSDLNMFLLYVFSHTARTVVLCNWVLFFLSPFFLSSTSFKRGKQRLWSSGLELMFS